jgi:large subunit ribosomal protein L29
MKAKDMREKSAADLLELEKSLAKDAFQARFKNFTARLDDTSSLRKSRRDIARVKTILRERAKAAPAAEAPAKAPAKAPKAAKAAATTSAPAKKKASAKKASEASK